MGDAEPKSKASREALRQPGGCDWASLGSQARVYLAAGAWRSAHDLLWERIRPHWGSLAFSSTAMECLCLLMGACARLQHSGHLERAYDWIERIRDSDLELHPEAAALTALTLALQDTRQGKYAQARARLEEIPSASIDRVTDCTRARIALLQGRIEAVAGCQKTAEMHGLEAARLSAATESDSLSGDAFTLLAIVARRRGSLEEANALYAKAAKHYWQSGNVSGHASVLLNRGWAVGLIGLLPDATRLFEESLNLTSSLGHHPSALRARLGLGWVALRGGDLTRARETVLRVWRDARRLGLPREEGIALEYLAETYLLSRDLPKARIAERLCRRLASRLAPEGDLALEARIREATVSLAVEDFAAARRQAAAAIDHARRIDMPWEEAQASRVGAMATLQAGDLDEAYQTFERAREILRRMGERLESRVIDAWLEALDAVRSTEPGGELPAEGRAEPVSSPLEFWLNHPLLGPKPYLRRLREPATATPVAEEAPRARRRTPPPADRTTPWPPEAGPSCHPIWAELGLVTRSPDILETLRLAETYAPGMLPVLVLGETGTGKDLIAQGLRALSRQSGCFVPVNCAAARKDLFVAELFGAERGSYTGAIENRRGLIREAENGTIFFDEVADLEPEAQGFILRFLDTGEVRAIGATKSHRVLTRVVAATCRDLSERVRAGHFRADLYARLAGLVLRLPPLRERREDLDLLIEMLWEREGGSRDDCRTVFTPAVLGALRQWRWPGNVRELKHTVSRGLLYRSAHGAAAARAYILRGTERGAEVPEAAESRPPRRGEWDPELLQSALESAGGRVAEAARILGISRGHAYRLYKKMRLIEH